jgi:hypothetical protein
LVSTPPPPRRTRPGAPALLFAGEVADRVVVLLRDGPRVARYTREDGEELLEVFAEPGNGVANWPALRLADTDAGTHYLLPPWVSEADTASGGAEGTGESGASVLEVPGPRSDSPPTEEVSLTALDVRGDEMTVLSP